MEQTRSHGQAVLCDVCGGLGQHWGSPHTLQPPELGGHRRGSAGKGVKGPGVLMESRIRLSRGCPELLGVQCSRVCKAQWGVTAHRCANTDGDSLLTGVQSSMGSPALIPPGLHTGSASLVSLLQTETVYLAAGRHGPSIRVSHPSTRLPHTLVLVGS